MRTLHIRRRALAVLAAVLLAGTGAAFASGATTAECTPPTDPSSLAQQQAWQACRFDALEAKVDALAKPAVTVTETATTTATATVTKTATQTVTAAPTTSAPTTATVAPTTTTASPTTTATPTDSPTTTTPSSGTKPGPNNTGVPAGVTLTPYTGPLTITQEGTVIDGKDVTGALNIKAKNVTIKNSKIHGDLSAVAGINVTDGSLTITDSEIYDFSVGIVYTNWTAIRVEIRDITFDAVKMSSNARLQDSWIHSPKPTPDAHWDGVQVQNGVVNTYIVGNNIDPTGGDANSALFLCPDIGPTTNGPLVVTGNWVNGGNYTVNILDGNNGEYFIKDITFSGNRFGRDGRYGPTYVNVPVKWSGNVWDDTGAPIQP